MDGHGGAAAVTPEAYMALTTSSYGATSEFMKDDRGALRPETEPILEAATKFLWEDMKETLEAFCINHADLFAGVADGDPSRDRTAEMALRDALGVGPAAGPLGDSSGGGLGAFRSVKAPQVEGEQRRNQDQDCAARHCVGKPLMKHATHAGFPQAPEQPA